MTASDVARDNLRKLTDDEAASAGKCREREALERSFKRFQFKVGKRTWDRADLYFRS
jgi:hypothetical protein